MAERLRIVRVLRHLIAEHAEALAMAAAAVRQRPIAEKLVSEVLPLADACRWLERHAQRVLAPRKLGRRGRPMWLFGVESEVQRQAFGKVLIVAPGNYPLFLPAVQALQALVAGNTVLLKPAPGTREVLLAFARLATEAGLDPALLVILPDTVEAGLNAIGAGVDLVIFTGSCANGRSVLARLAETNTPSIMELSGEDAVLVLADADIDLVTQALRFGVRLNGGETCIAPRQLIIVESMLEKVRRALRSADLELAFRIHVVASDSAAVALANSLEFALGASIFSGDAVRARALAAQLQTGFVLINDLIVPTADPRLPFGGVRASGFGVTRGEDGLLALTHPHVVVTRRGRPHPHFEAPAAEDAVLFTSYIQATHGERRLSALCGFVRALLAKAKSRKNHS